MLMHILCMYIQTPKSYILARCSQWHECMTVQTFQLHKQAQSSSYFCSQILSIQYIDKPLQGLGTRLSYLHTQVYVFLEAVLIVTILLWKSLSCISGTIFGSKTSITRRRKCLHTNKIPCNKIKF